EPLARPVYRVWSQSQCPSCLLPLLFLLEAGRALRAPEIKKAEVFITSACPGVRPLRPAPRGPPAITPGNQSTKTRRQQTTRCARRSRAGDPGRYASSGPSIVGRAPGVNHFFVG